METSQERFSSLEIKVLNSDIIRHRYMERN